MYSSLISKIEKAKRYAEEPDRITFESFDVRFRGDNSSHRVSLKGDEWSCECDHFHTSGLCAHVMTMQRVLANHLPEAVRYTTEHPVLA
ncbi:MAG TPA: SWIM zinc finger family protein [Candidatus Limnocylindrales bacterium]|nr:SWIM zinc finger family protein [Candidatus Limnocylindrales bacterium]